jgi:hypothetical protein
MRHIMLSEVEMSHFLPVRSSSAPLCSARNDNEQCTTNLKR